MSDNIDDEIDAGNYRHVIKLDENMIPFYSNNLKSVIAITNIIVAYTILLIFILAMIYLKIKQKEKYTFWLWVLFCYVIVLPILYLCTIGYFSSSHEILNIDTLNINGDTLK
jgi:hypothetical protein